MTWAYSPPRRNKRPHGLARDFALAHAVCDRRSRGSGYGVGERGRLFEKLDFLRQLGSARRLHGRVAVLNHKFGKMRPESLGENRIGFIQPEPAVGQPVLLQCRPQNVSDQSLDQSLLLNDRNGMGFLYPGHGPVDSVAFSSGAEEDRLPALNKEGPVQRRRFACNQLRPQIRQIAAVLVLPDEQRVKSRSAPLCVRFGDPLCPQCGVVDSALVTDVPWPLSEMVRLHCLALPPQCDRQPARKALAFIVRCCARRFPTAKPLLLRARAARGRS